MQRIHPFNLTARALGTQMANAATLLTEIPGIDTAEFDTLYRDYLRLVSDTAGMLARVHAYHQYLITYREHVHAFEIAEHTERRMGEARQHWTAIANATTVQSTRTVA